MEDSSINPYIPNESDKIRQKVYEQQSPLGRVLKWSLFGTILVSLLLGIGLYFVNQNTVRQDNDARARLADILQPPDQTQKRYKVESSIGFSFVYDDKYFKSTANVFEPQSVATSNSSTGVLETFKDNELRISRPYTYVTISPRLSTDSDASLSPDLPQLDIDASSSSKDLAKLLTVKENSGLSKLDVFVKTQTDKRKSTKIRDDNTTVTVDSTKPAKVTINKVDYKKVRFTTTNNNYQIANVKYDDCYYTIEYDQPYSVCVSNVQPLNAYIAGNVEQLIKSVTFQEPKTTKPDDQKSLNQTSAQPNPELPLATVQPYFYKDENSLKAIAKNQPSVVRIGTIYCADIALKLQTGEVATNLTNACIKNSANGVFVSQDGHIATTAHALKFSKQSLINAYINLGEDNQKKLDRLQSILDYMLKARLLLQSSADYLKRGAAVNDPEALAKVQNLGTFIDKNLITISNEEWSYAVQLKQQPISFDFTNSKPTFAYSDTVKKATLVASNYEPVSVAYDEYTNSIPSVDVALLKIDGNYPSAYISDTSKTTIKSNDRLNIIGYVSYADSSLASDTNLPQFPIATATQVEQVKDSSNLIKIDTVIPAGNDGAPVFDKSGKMIGLASSGLAYCPDEQCLGNGIIRPVNELVKLLDNKNISLKTNSPSSAKWANGVNEFFVANYASALSSFTQAGGLYENNRWASPLEKLSSELRGTKLDTSFMNQLGTVIVITIIVLFFGTLILSIVYFLQKRRAKNLRVGLYGLGSTNDQGPAPEKNIKKSSVSSNNQSPNDIGSVSSEQANSGQNQIAEAGPTEPTSKNAEDPFYK